MPRIGTPNRLHQLTVKQVQAAIDGDLSDGGGLLLRVRGASWSWVLRYTSPAGRRREMGLGVALRGSARQIGDSLTGARDAAHKARELLRQGRDPIEHRDQAREAARQAEGQVKATKAREQSTLARCARDYHERVIERTRTAKHAAQWISSLEHHVPASVWNAPIDTITPPILLQALEGATPHERARRPGDLGETLRRVRQRLDSVFEDAAFHGRCASNPAAAIKRKLTECRPRGKRGNFRALPYRDAPAFLRALRAAPGTAARCLELLLLTAARTDEVLGANRSEFDLDGADWTIPGERMKAGEDHVVFLVPRAVEIVCEHAAFMPDAAVVFPSPMDTEKPLSNMALLAVLDRMGMRQATTVHGLRSTFSTWANETQAARPDVIEACLAHQETDRVRAAYNRAQFADERRTLLLAWADYLGTPAAKVIPLRAA